MQRLLLAIILLEMPVQLDTYLLHQEEIASFGTIGGFNMSLTTICLGLLYLLWIPALVARSRFPDAPRLRVGLAALIYLGTVTISLAAASNRLLSLFELWLLLQAFLLYFYVANNVRTRGDLLFTMCFLVLGLPIQGIIMLVLRQLGNDVHFGPVKLSIDDASGRISGTLGSVILAASYFTILIPATMAFFMTPVRTALKVLAAIAIALSLVGLVLTQSRGGWIATLFACAIVLFFVWQRGWMPAKVPLLLGAAGLACVVIFQGVIIERIYGDDRGSAFSRVPLSQLAMEIIRDHPLEGIGLNNCATIAQHYATGPAYRAEWFYTVHNKYLLTWLELGVFGLAAYLGFLTHTIYLAWRTWLRRDRLISMLGLAFGAGILGQMIHMSVDVFNSRPQTEFLWLVAGLITALRWMDDPS